MFLSVRYVSLEVKYYYICGSSLKVTIPSKIKIQSFIHPRLVQNLFDILSSEHKSRNFEKCE